MWQGSAGFWSVTCAGAGPSVLTRAAGAGAAGGVSTTGAGTTTTGTGAGAGAVGFFTTGAGSVVVVVTAGSVVVVVVSTGCVGGVSPAGRLGVWGFGLADGRVRGVRPLSVST